MCFDAVSAMAVGIPVILPPEARTTFGDAAIYAEPEGVVDAVFRLWSPATFAYQVDMGRRFVDREMAIGQISGRLVDALS